LRRGTLTQDAPRRRCSGGSPRPEAPAGHNGRRWPFRKTSHSSHSTYTDAHRLGIWIYDAFAAEAARDGWRSTGGVMPLFHEISREIEGGSYELYAEVAQAHGDRDRQTPGRALEPSRSGFLPDSVQRWKPSETNIRCRSSPRSTNWGCVEHRRQASGPDQAPHPRPTSTWSSRAAGPLLQARTAPFHRVRPAHGGQARLGARGRQPLHDVAPCINSGAQ